MNTINMISEERLKNIPKKLRIKHEMCFYLHDQMVHMLKEAEINNFSVFPIPVNDRKLFEKSISPIDYLLSVNEFDLAKKITINHCILALIADSLHFIYESLISIEKRKFSVTFSLLRKPLKDNILYLSMIAADNALFFKNLQSYTAENFSKYTQDDKLRLDAIRKSVPKINGINIIDPDLIHQIIFDRSFKNGLSVLFDKSLHLITKNKHIKTEDFNINFIFKDLEEDDLYHHIYNTLPYILYYYLFLQINLYKNGGMNIEKMENWYSFSVPIAYHSIFSKYKKSIQLNINKIFSEFLECPHCDKKIKIKKIDMAKFIIKGDVFCSNCLNNHNFPVFWLYQKYLSVEEKTPTNPDPSLSI